MMSARRGERARARAKDPPSSAEGYKEYKFVMYELASLMEVSF